MKIHLKSFTFAATISTLCSSLFITSSVFAAAVIDPLTEPASVAAPHALSNTDLSSGTEKAYRPWFENGTWMGDIVEYDITAGGSLSTTVVLDTTPTNTGANWSARLQFAANVSNNADYWKVSSASGVRKVITSITGTDQVEFDWAQLTSTQKTAMDSANAGNASSDILDFIRGDRSKEIAASGTLRDRASLLGDIVHSNPVYVGAPAASFNLPGYTTYKTANKADPTTASTGQADRTPIVYVGANDGMLHAFNADTGNEVFAYVPSMLFGNLNKLTASAPYAHTYFVDGELSVGDIFFGSTAFDWRTILVGGLGSGGKGMYALDITYDSLSTLGATSGSSKKVLWEKTTDDFGYIHGKAQIALLNDANWYTIQGNGYSSVNDVAKLMLIDTAGAVTSILTDATTGNGLSSPALVDTNADGKPDYAYAGDIKGNLWKFDLTTRADALKLFSTTSVDQPITSVPEIGRHPNGGIIIYFGTGSLLSAPSTTNDDVNNTAAQTFYALWDNNATAEIANDGSILSQPFTEIAYNSGTTVRYSTDNTAINWGPNTGWKVPFPAGERVVGDPQLRAGRLQFMTTSFTADDQPVAWLMELNYLNGGVDTKIIFNLNGDTLRNDDDTVDRTLDGGGLPIAGSGKIPIAIKYGDSGVFAQPTIARVDNNSDTLFVNGLLMPLPATCSGSCSGGFIGGHVDVDTDSYFAGKITWNDPGLGAETNGHHHEYDKSHGVVFTDYFDLEPRRGLYSLGYKTSLETLASKLNRISEVCDPNQINAVCDSNTPDNKLFGNVQASKDKKFFIAIANADLNPGATITIGSKSWNVKDYQDMITPLIQARGNADISADASFKDPADDVSLIYTYAGLNDNLRLDYDSSSIVDGLMVGTVTGCVKGDKDPYLNLKVKDQDKNTTNVLQPSNNAHITNAQESGLEGYRWRNGALTIQIIDATNYTMQPAADVAHQKTGADAGFPTGGTHAKFYGQSGFSDDGTKITIDQANNASPVIESGLLYESTVFNHWGDLFELRISSDQQANNDDYKPVCYGAPNYQSVKTIERGGLTLGEYNVLIGVFDTNAGLEAALALILADLDAATTEAEKTTAREALNTLIGTLSNADKDKLVEYLESRTYIRGKIPTQHLLDMDQGLAAGGSLTTATTADVQDGSTDDDQLGQNFRTGRRTWIDLTP